LPMAAPSHPPPRYLERPPFLLVHCQAKWRESCCPIRRDGTCDSAGPQTESPAVSHARHTRPPRWWRPHRFSLFERPTRRTKPDDARWLATVQPTPPPASVADSRTPASPARWVVRLRAPHDPAEARARAAAPARVRGPPPRLCHRRAAAWAPQPDDRWTTTSTSTPPSSSTRRGARGTAPRRAAVTTYRSPPHHLPLHARRRL